MERTTHIPVIGISARSAQHPSTRAIVRQVREEDGKPLILSHHTLNLTQRVRNDLGRIDALVLMGNSFDIAPQHYIHRYPEGDAHRHIHPETKSELSNLRAKARARYEDAILSLAIKNGVPILGICGGMQRINVQLGGTLHQHIPDLVGCNKHMQHKQGIAPHIPVVPIIIKENTLLAHIACGIHMPFASCHSPDAPKVIMENSLHHQSMDRIGEHLRVCAITDTVRMKDGTNGYLAEAIEVDPDGVLAKQFILGVQWHPEFGASSLGERIVRHLITAAHTFARSRCSRLAISRVDSITRIC